MPYYKTHEVFPGTWRISEALGVGEYLLEGDKKALLIDTGFGFVDLRRTISKITKKTVEVVNSHGHVDHAGGNNQFEKIWIDKDDVFMLDEAWKKSQLDLLINYGKRVNPALNLMLFYFRLQRFRKYNTRAEALPENVVFDLGGRKIGTMRVPGHSPGSVIFLDESTKTVFAGDALNPSVFLFFDEHLKLKSYADRIEAIASLRGFDQFYTSHQAGAIPFSYAGWYADFLRRVDVNKSALTDIPNGNRPVYKYAEQCEVLDGSEAAVCFASDNV